jgi:RNA-directed DNA polymerase
MEVTGLTVNQFLNVRRKFVHEIRGALHASEQYGLDLAQQHLPLHYYRQLRTKKLPRLLNFIRGKLLYLKMIRGERDRIYVRLARRFNRLLEHSPSDPKYGIASPLVVHALVTADDEIEKAVHVIRCENTGDEEHKGSEGTAFFLEGIGIITCEHVVKVPDTSNYFKDGEKGHISLYDRYLNRICYLEIAYLWPDIDIAVLKPVTSIPESILWLPPSLAVTKKNNNARLAGYPNHSTGKSISVYDGKVVSEYKKFTYDHFDIDTLIRKGTSGGPVLGEGWQVIGVAKEGATQSEGNNAVIAIHELLKKLEIENQLSS